MGGGSEFIFLTPPPSVSTHGGSDGGGGQPKISQKLSSTWKRIKNLWAKFENPDLLWLFEGLFLYLFIDFLWEFFPIFKGYQHIFMGGVRPPWLPTFFQIWSQNFFRGGSGSRNRGSDSFRPPLREDPGYTLVTQKQPLYNRWWNDRAIRKFINIGFKILSHIFNHCDHLFSLGIFSNSLFIWSVYFPYLKKIST